jgi:membrane-bound serine protease (ClpP class)
MGPNTAFVVLIIGMLGIYAELVWPGPVIPAIVGLGAALSGGYFLFRSPLSAGGVGLLVAGAVLLIAEAVRGPYFVLGSLGSIALTVGFCLLLESPRRIEMALAIPLSLVFGVCSVLLAAGAKRARRNKCSDLNNAKYRGTFRQ